MKLDENCLLCLVYNLLKQQLSYRRSLKRRTVFLQRIVDTNRKKSKKNKTRMRIKMVKLVLCIFRNKARARCLQCTAVSGLCAYTWLIKQRQWTNTKTFNWPINQTEVDNFAFSLTKLSLNIIAFLISSVVKHVGLLVTHHFLSWGKKYWSARVHIADRFNGSW